VCRAKAFQAVHGAGQSLECFLNLIRMPTPIERRRAVMKIIVGIVFALLLTVIASAAEIKGTILKVDKTTNRIVLKTERGEETFETTKSTKGVEHVKEGNRVVITFSEKDGEPKISEIAPEN
jgi:hypothetical protein